MSWLFLLWLLSFILLAALLGITMYMLICISDLENDFINPHDSASRMNTFKAPEVILQGTLTILYFLTGRWFMFCLNVPVATYHARLYARKEYLVDVTEIFNQIGVMKKRQLAKLAFYLICFCIVVWRWVEATVLMFSDHPKAHL